MGLDPQDPLRSSAHAFKMGVMQWRIQHSSSGEVWGATPRNFFESRPSNFPNRLESALSEKFDNAFEQISKIVV